MKRLVPSPLLSLALLVLWVSLMQSLSAGTIVIGVVLALGLPALTERLRVTPVRARHPLVMVRLFGRMVIEMLRSNIQVARVILFRRSRDIPPKLVTVPLDLRDPTGLTLLAMMLTFVPGTVWVRLEPNRSQLLLHVLAVGDEAELVRFIKRQFELPLMEIFE